MLPRPSLLIELGSSPPLSRDAWTILMAAGFFFSPSHASGPWVFRIWRASLSCTAGVNTVVLGSMPSSLAAWSMVPPTIW